MSSSFNPDTLSGASMLATMLASQAKPGFSADPADYLPTWVKLSGAEFNDNSKFYRSDLDPATDFLIGGRVVGAEGEPVIVVGSVSGWEVRDRFFTDGKPTTKRFAIWKTKPSVTPVTGKGGGLQTADGRWLAGQFDEIFLLVGHELCVITLYDMHHIVTGLNRQALALGVEAMFNIKWRLTKTAVSDDRGYTHYEPRFEMLGVAGEPNGPSEAELKQAKTLSPMIAKLSHPLPGAAPLPLVVNGPPIDNPPPWDDPPPPDLDDPGPDPEDAGHAEPIDDDSDRISF